MGRSSFWKLASGSGPNRVRLSLLDSVTRADVLACVQSGLGRLAPEDYLWEGEIICAVTHQGRHSKVRPSLAAWLTSLEAVWLG
ncbi:MAG TPA: hypothetical protein VGJ54_19225 [Streptosporangiaceae bacterium]